MAPSNYMNYYTGPTQQQQQGNYSYNSYSNTRAAPASTQYQPTPGATVAQDGGYSSQARSNDRYSTAQNGPGYSNRTNYDTNTLGVLSHNAAVNNDSSRGSTGSTGYAGYQASNHVPAQTQSYAAVPQPTYNSSTHAIYGQQQVRPDSVNSMDSSQSSLSAPRASQPAQSQAPQYHQRVGSAVQRAPSPLQAQWTAYNHTPQHALPAPRTSDVAGRAASQHVQNQPAQPRTSRSNDVLQTPAHRSLEEQPSAPVTVDPSQVYDPYHEYQRQAKRAEAEAEKRKAAEAAEAAERAKLEQAAKAREEEMARNNPKTVPIVSPPTENIPEVPPKKKRNRKSENTSGSAKSKSKAKKNTVVNDVDEPAQAAAMTLMQTANSAAGTDLEAQMREMFKKMREFNAQDPELLSKLWQQERDEHLAKEAGVAQPPPSASPTSPQLRKQVPAAKTTTEAPRPVATPPVANTLSLKAGNVTSVPKTSTSGAVNNPVNKASAALHASTAPATVTPSAPSISAQAARNSGTIWPADKKQTLAAAASRLLQNMPANRGKLISAEEISTILDTNPSYIELCHTIESKGFKVDRSFFAKALLAAVPDVNKSAQKPMTTVVDGTITKLNETMPAIGGTANAAGTISTVSGNTSTSLSNAADRLLSGGNVVETPTPTPSKMKAKEKPAKEKPNKDKQAHSRKGKKAPANIVSDNATHPTPPLQASDTLVDDGLEGLEAVRRFVDGTWQDAPSPLPLETPASSKPIKSHRPSKSQSRPIPLSAPPAPVTKEDLARKRTFADLVELTQLDSDDESILYPSAKRHEGDYSVDHGVSHLPTPPETLIGPTITPSIIAPNFTSNIAPNFAPELDQRAPNSPNAPPARTETESRTTALPVPPVDHPARNVRMVQPLDKYKAIRRSTYNPKTIARDVLLACGRHPDMRHLNAHLEALKTVFTSIDNGADLGTFRWDIADPGGPAPGSGNALPDGLEILDISEDADDENDEEDNDNDSVLGRTTVRQIVDSNGGSHLETGHAGGSAVRKLHPKKIRHSEPGVRSHTDQPARSVRPRHSEGGNIRSNASSDKAATPASSTMPSGYAALRALQAGGSGDTPKKKGRPVGWRKWMMKDPSTYMGGAQGSKSKVARTVKPPEPEPAPVYQVYKCEWRDCGAELHNLATLRKHIHKLHGKKDENDMYPCHWNECGKVRSITENGRTSSRFVHEDFRAAEPWKQHVEKKHIDPIAWELGDGPAGGISDQHDSELSDAYLSDSRGRRVTPTVVVPSLAALAANSTPRGISNAEREARELQRIAEKRKRDMGPGIDKGGARLANDKRRQGFMDDDDTAEVVEYDD